MNDLSTLRRSVSLLVTAVALVSGPLAWGQEKQAEKAVNLDVGVEDTLVRQNLMRNLFDDRVAATWFLAKARDPMDELLGATFQPIGNALRTQLGIPAGQGLLVASVRADGPSALAGLVQNDVLLTLADKPLASADDLTKQLKAAGDATAPLTIYRAGKAQTLAVRPVYRVTLGPAAEPKPEYFLGVTVETADDALRAQLNLPAGKGLLVTEVIAASPAEKAGVQKYDVALELSGKALDTFETLAAQVQTNKDKPVKLKLLRGGKEMTLTVAGTLRKVEAQPPVELLRYYNFVAQEQNAPDRFSYLAALAQTAAQKPEGDEVRKRLDRLDKEMKALREAIENVNKTLQGKK